MNSDRSSTVNHTRNEREIKDEKKKVISSCTVGVDSFHNFYTFQISQRLLECLFKGNLFLLVFQIVPFLL